MASNSTISVFCLASEPPRTRSRRAPAPARRRPHPQPARRPPPPKHAAAGLRVRAERALNRGLAQRRWPTDAAGLSGEAPAGRHTEHFSEMGRGEARLPAWARAALVAAVAFLAYANTLHGALRRPGRRLPATAAAHADAVAICCCTRGLNSPTELPPFHSRLHIRRQLCSRE